MSLTCRGWICSSMVKHLLSFTSPWVLASAPKINKNKTKEKKWKRRKGKEKEEKKGNEKGM